MSLNERLDLILHISSFWIVEKHAAVYIFVFSLLCLAHSGFKTHPISFSYKTMLENI